MIDIIITTPTEKIFEGKIKEIYIPTSNGDVGVFHDHSPMISSIHLGELHFIDSNNKKHILIVSEGLAQIKFNKMYISVISGTYPHEINPDVLEAEIKELEKIIEEEKKNKIEVSKIHTRIINTKKYHIASYHKHRV
ncbi:ATP synthase F1 subunit epsilon [Patescibacteria group bacterium]|nr:ATP synthase F1 subunit epsilon [Patescibacteria group bacterium]